MTESGSEVPIARQPPRDTVAPEDLPYYDRVVARQNAYGYGRAPGEEAGPYFGALLHNPRIADHISELGVIYRTRGETPGSYTHADREWVDLTVGNAISKPILMGHMLDAVAQGVRPDAIAALLDDRLDDLTQRERQLTDYIRAVLSGEVTAERWTGIVELFGMLGAVEYTAFIGHLIMTSRLQSAFFAGKEAEMAAFFDQKIRENLEGLLAETIELPDPKARVPSLEHPLGS